MYQFEAESAVFFSERALENSGHTMGSRTITAKHELSIYYSVDSLYIQNRGGLAIFAIIAKATNICSCSFSQYRGGSFLRRNSPASHETPWGSYVSAVLPSLQHPPQRYPPHKRILPLCQRSTIPNAMPTTIPGTLGCVPVLPDLFRCKFYHLHLCAPDINMW